MTFTSLKPSQYWALDQEMIEVPTGLKPYGFESSVGRLNYGSAVVA